PWVERAAELISSLPFCNYYGTPKPPAEPALVQPDLVDQVLFDEDYGVGEGPRKRTTSVSNMDRKDSAVPEEEDDDERPPLPNGLPEHKEGAEWRKTVPSYNQSSTSMDFRTWSSLPRDDSLEPLPLHWEMAYTETGMVYFIDHNTKCTTWLDPRLAKKAKPPEKCEDGELPYGWEEIDDPQYGTYYVDHINQKTQFENPVLEAKKRLNQDTSALLLKAAGGVASPFTSDPSQLDGELYHTALRKSPHGFGFTIIGGDRTDEFLQVKNVLKDGPAAQDNKMASGDVIVEINGTCVLGKTHPEVVAMFQSIPVNQYVDMVLCHGYQLPPDVDLDGDDPPVCVCMCVIWNVWGWIFLSLSSRSLADVCSSQRNAAFSKPASTCTFPSYMHTNSHTCTLSRMHTLTCAHSLTCTLSHTSTLSHMHALTHSHMHALTYAHSHTHKHTHTHPLSHSATNLCTQTFHRTIIYHELTHTRTI
uniref:Membrane associated guanylate kinase, WW and PDZ domain containing 3b n=1 Tax=Gadus morhua TaxID=8049 RepID=A0A8C5FNM0_GADMO